MEVVHDETALRRYMAAAIGVTPDRPILIDRFLCHAIETEADAIADHGKAFVPAVMQHIELAGIHSGDSACIIPSMSIPPKHVETINRYTELIANSLNVCGLMNMQYAIADDTVYVLEANPRASRTVPLVSKVCNLQMAKVATRAIMHEFVGGDSPIDSLKHRDIPYYGVKEAVFPFNMFPEVDPVLGPEMRSTGEVLGISPSFGEAYYKAQEGTQVRIPDSGSVLISVTDDDKEEAIEVATVFKSTGLNIVATEGTAKFLRENGIECETVRKLYEGRPNLMDGIMNGEITFVINTPMQSTQAAQDDSYIRRTSVRKKICYLTTMAAAKAAAIALDDRKNKPKEIVKSLQEYHGEIK
jgi:carbamoyl-phosphate synthase large subunit